LIQVTEQQEGPGLEVNSEGRRIYAVDQADIPVLIGLISRPPGMQVVERMS